MSNTTLGNTSLGNADATKIVEAEDASAAPIEHVTGGIDGVAAFLHTATADTTIPLAAEPLATTTEPPAVQAPTSDARNEPLPIALPENPAEAFAEQGPLPGEPSPTPVEQQPTQEAAQTPAEDKMDTSEDGPATTETGRHDEAELLLEQPDEPMESVEPTVTPDLSAVVSTIPPPTEKANTPTPLHQEQATTGQVRPREDDDEVEPVAKRAKTESIEEEASATVPEAPATTAEAAGPAPALDGVPPPGAVATTANSTPVPATTPTLQKTNLDSNPITPAQTKFLLEQIRKAKKTKSALAYLIPVDPVALNIPSYPEIVKHPMDLKTMEENLKSNQYVTADDMMVDFEQMVQNSQIFNGPQHPIAQAGQSLRAYFIKCVSMMPKGDAAKAQDQKPKKPEPAPPKTTRPARTVTVTAPAKSPSNEKPAGFLNEHGMPIIRRDSSAQNDRPKREIHPPKRDLPASSSRPKKKKAQLELKFCETVVAELHKKKHGTYAYPFLHPVDPVALNIPNYLRIIKKPMDFGTIQSNLKSGLYVSAKEFYADSKLVFANCYKFNPPADEVYKMGKLTEEIFDTEWAKKDAWIANNQPPSEPASEDEEEEEEVEEEVEEDPNIRRMQEIQAQIAALSQEALQLTTGGRRPSPKALTKSKTPKATSSKPKPIPKPTMAAPKPPKSKPKPKPKKLTLEQKREVSEGIANLDEAKMRKAVQIIRNGVPSLAVSLDNFINRLYNKENRIPSDTAQNVQDDELELDIDEIPEDVVYKLWEFVRPTLAKKEREPSPEYYDEGDDDDYQGRTSATGPRRKNKPMKAQEQEERIKQLQEKLTGSGANGSGESQSPAARHHETEDEGDSESSEEE
jgi:bromodomain-containing factor 1